MKLVEIFHSEMYLLVTLYRKYVKLGQTLIKVFVLSKYCVSIF